MVLLIIRQKMRKRWQMIGLISINHFVKTKDKKHQSGEGNGLNQAAIFTGSYGWFREFGGCRVLMAKFDVESAYRNIPVHQDDFFLLGTRWRGQFYVLRSPFCTIYFQFRS